jgi:hypothetical protein
MSYLSPTTAPIRILKNHSDYITRLPPYTPVSDGSRRQWKLMERDLLPVPAPSKELINKEISHLKPKRAGFRQIVLACQTGDVKTLRKLLWSNKRLSLNRKYGDPGKSAKLTPLCWAALNGHLDVVECLLDGLIEDPNKIEMRILEEMSMILRGERAPLDRPSLVKPSLAKSSYASTWGSSISSIGSQSLTRTANIEMCDSEGRTPLMLATYGGHLEVVCTLLEHGSKILIVDGCGRNVLHYARQNKRNDINDVIKNTLRERQAIKLQLKLQEEARLKEYFAAILRRVAAGGKKKNNEKNKFSAIRKQRPMTAPFNRRKIKKVTQKPHTSHSQFSRYAYEIR